ncbi:hypothetical protein BGZ46_006155 [Entomortierella lignicola]|nr:hypothetical protein BGZ46_006155 [Entomortierella lignicola]
MTTTKSTETAQEDPAVEALRKGLAAIALELERKQADLESTQTKLETVQPSLTATQVALDASERARQTANSELEEANRSSRKPTAIESIREEVFVVLRFRQPKPLPEGGGYHFLARQRKAVDRVIKSYKAKHPELDAIEILRIEPTARAQNLYLKMKVDAEAPIELSRQNFILKKDYKEDKMIEYITQIFSLYTPGNVTTSTA